MDLNIDEDVVDSSFVFGKSFIDANFIKRDEQNFLEDVAHIKADMVTILVDPLSSSDAMLQDGNPFEKVMNTARLRIGVCRQNGASIAPYASPCARRAPAELASVLLVATSFAFVAPRRARCA